MLSRSTSKARTRNSVPTLGGIGNGAAFFSFHRDSANTN
jgi:hypothetical protein